MIPSSGKMRASAIFASGASERDLSPFQKTTQVSWQIGLPNPNDKSDVIVLFGGDGTIHRQLRHLVELQLPVLVVPRGSGNDFARALHLKSPENSLAAWRKFTAGDGNLKSVDVGVIQQLGGSGTEYLFATVSGVGLDGEVARRANRLPRWLRGNGGYAMTLLPLLFQLTAWSMKITREGEIPGNFEPIIVAAMANVPTFGGGMKIAPQAQFDDGLLDVCTIRDISPFKLFCLFPTIYFGRHLDIHEVQYSRTPRVRVETEHPLDVYADGEYVCRTPVEVSLRRAALHVIVP